MLIVPFAKGLQDLHKFWWGYAIALGAIILLWLIKELIDVFAVLSSNRRSASSFKVVPCTSLRRFPEKSPVACVGTSRACFALPHRATSVRLSSCRLLRAALLVKLNFALTRVPHHFALQ